MTIKALNVYANYLTISSSLQIYPAIVRITVHAINILKSRVNHLEIFDNTGIINL